MKGVASRNVEVKTWYSEGRPSWKGPVDPKRAYFKARSRASSPAEIEDAPYKNQVNTAAITITMPTHLHSILHDFRPLLQSLPMFSSSLNAEMSLSSPSSGTRLGRKWRSVTVTYVARPVQCLPPIPARNSPVHTSLINSLVRFQ